MYKLKPKHKVTKILITSGNVPTPVKAARKDWDKQQWGSKQEKFKDRDSGYQWDMGANTELKWGLRYVDQTNFIVSERKNVCPMMTEAGGMTWQATSTANIFPSTWIQISKTQVHSHALHITATLAFSPAKRMMVLLAFEAFHPHLWYLCSSVLHLIMIFPRAGSRHLNRSFGRERLATSFTMWDRCFSKCLFCGGLQRQLSAFVGYLQT